MSASETPLTAQPPQPEAASQKPYEGKFSFLQRIFKVLVSPREGIEDVALAPSYDEAFGILAIQIFVSLVAIWLIESVIVKFACNKGSGWDLKTAASITGYTYLVDMLLSIITTVVSWPFIPSMVIDIKNLGLTQQTIAALKTQLTWLWLWLLPVSLFGIV